MEKLVVNFDFGFDFCGVKDLLKKYQNLENEFVVLFDQIVFIVLQGQVLVKFGYFDKVNIFKVVEDFNKR